MYADRNQSEEIRNNKMLWCKYTCNITCTHFVVRLSEKLNLPDINVRVCMLRVCVRVLYANNVEV